MSVVTFGVGIRRNVDDFAYFGGSYFGFLLVEFLNLLGFMVVVYVFGMV